MVIKIAFHSEIIDVRGSCVAIYDYANYNEILLNNKSVIVVPLDSITQNRNDDIAVTKFMQRFQVYFYKDKDDLENFISDCDILYTIKFGKNNNLFSTKIKTVVHCVFDMTEPHGDIYAGVSEQIADKFNQRLWVPHMIGLRPSLSKENLRKQYNIADTAIVFGRFSGHDTFNIDFVHHSIEKIVNERDDIYFLFANTPIFYKHKQIIYLSKIVDDIDKNKFISTCDAHLECSNFGQSFGLNIGEFSVNNKPIICYNGWTWNQSHFKILKDKAIKFATEEEFYNIITSFNAKDYEDKDMNCYKNFTPEIVMKQFKEIFID